METLKEKFENLSLPWEDGKQKELEEIFNKQLAPDFLYGGYIRVLDRYRVYIQCVEFYFHSEEPNGIKDEIVYHRNNYHVEGELPYFVPLTFHAHASGFDIAFENPILHYRASALIRAYELFDEKVGKFIKVENGKFILEDGKLINKPEYNGKPHSDYKFIYADEPETNTQSTYLYDILNGFGNAGEITWVTKPLPFYNNQKPNPKERKGVYKGDKWTASKYEEPRKREWGFDRKKLNKSDIN
ncbi:MAG: hypothetical protein IJ915_06440 [Paludibacteraceae bacterium]|nr:hypothetical protein [Paludibacteraceae bacterium]